DQFRSLQALEQGQPGDADSKHFDWLWGHGFLEKDRRTIRSDAAAVLRNSFEETKEGPVIAPLRLMSERDRPIPGQALRECDVWVHDFLSGKDNQDRSPD